MAREKKHAFQSRHARVPSEYERHSISKEIKEISGSRERSKIYLCTRLELCKCTTVMSVLRQPARQSVSQTMKQRIH